MINDELGSLFSGDPSSPTPMSLRQGVVQSWDPDTGENSIQVAGGTLLNIPVLTSESASLVVGDVVALLAAGTKWFLLGKVTTPGDPGTVPSWNGDLTALAPLATLATVTDGTTITGATNITTDPGTGAHVVINDPAFPGEATLYSGNPDEVTPGRIRPAATGAADGRLELRSPTMSASNGYAFIDMSGLAAGTSAMDIQADSMEIIGGDFFRLTAPDGNMQLGDGTDWITVDGRTAYGDLAWTSLTLAGSWVQDTTNPPGAVGNAAPSYHKDANGNVHVRGYIRAGAAVTIATLPAGYRPTLTYESPLLRANTGSANFSTVRVQTNGVMDVFTNSASAFVRLSLNFMFPTL